MEKKHHHWVPQTYLNAWLDPKSPHKPGYVWKYDKNGKAWTNKSPQNIFAKSDFYTHHLPDGTRDLSLEDKLSRIENNFANVLRDKLKLKEILSEEDEASLLLFVSSMLSRTKGQCEHLINQGLTQYPLKNSLLNITFKVGQILTRMNWGILYTVNKVGFITSDAPCVLFNPEWQKCPSMMRTPGLCLPSIEITFPVTPQLMICLSWNNVFTHNQYIQINTKILNDLNRRTRFFCHNYFIVNQETTKSIWFKAK